MMVEFLGLIGLAASAVVLTGAAPQSGDAAPDAPATHPGESTKDEASVHRVEPGLAWHLVANDARPGDLVLLEKGIHINGRIEGLRGTRERPITIRGADPAVPTAIACEEMGLELIRCQWVRVENLYFINPLQAAILIDGGVEVDGVRTASEVSIAISNCRIATSREVPGLDAIRVRDARTVGIADCRFESWSDAAVELRGSSAVVITRCLFSPITESAHAFGVRALDGSEAIAVIQNTFERSVHTAVQIGACEAKGEALVPSRAKGVQFVRCALLDVECPIEIAAESEGTLRECTIVDPNTAYRVDARCGAPRLAVERCIFTWTPGKLIMPTERRGETSPAMVRLGANLWWSSELPTVFDAIERPYGTESAPQILDVDPKLSDKRFEPMEPKATSYGWLAPVPTPMAPPPGAPGNAPAPPAAAPAAPPATPSSPPSAPSRPARE